MSHFLKAAAKSLADEEKSSKGENKTKVRNEFVTVCMMNALFGNPCLNLVQMHDSYVGPRTLDRDFANYGQQTLADEDSIATSMKR